MINTLFQYHVILWRIKKCGIGRLDEQKEHSDEQKADTTFNDKQQIMRVKYFLYILPKT